MEMKHLRPTYRRDAEGSKAVADELKRRVESGEFGKGELLFPATAPDDPELPESGDEVVAEIRGPKPV